jgi:hypothetical protein
MAPKGSSLADWAFQPPNSAGERALGPSPTARRIGWHGALTMQQQQGHIVGGRNSRLYALGASDLHLMSIGTARERDLKIILFLT